MSLVHEHPKIHILDVIAKPYASWSDKICYYVIVDRMPQKVYAREGDRLTMNDDGIYDFLQIDPGSTGAFGGREFDIHLSDGSVYHANGDVWSVAPPKGIKETIDVGVSTIERLSDCYVFNGYHISRAKLDAWLQSNTPSNNYYKYDERETNDWLLQHRHSGARSVCANRARKLRRRGVIVWRDESGRRLWSPWYERRRQELEARIKNDHGSVRAGSKP